MMALLPDQLARCIDHTLLRPEATPDQIDALCDESVAYGFAAVCVNPAYVRRASDRLAAVRRDPESRPRPVVVSVVGFPLGANTTAVKMNEARLALDDGALEIDMVAAIGALAAGNRSAVRADIEAIAHVVHGSGSGAILKVILETAALTAEQLMLGVRCCAEGEADYVKTSTGFHPKGGAALEHVRLLYRLASPMKVKASGGIGTARDACAMIEAGASRLGTSSGVAIIEELRRSTP